VTSHKQHTASYHALTVNDHCGTCTKYLYLPCHQWLGSLELLHKLYCIQYFELLLKGALDDGGEQVRETLVWDVT